MIITVILLVRRPLLMWWKRFDITTQFYISLKQLSVCFACRRPLWRNATCGIL